MKTPWHRLGRGLIVVVVLGATFAAYLSPHMAVDLANRIWGCL
jgi:hypothetical protein